MKKQKLLVFLVLMSILLQPLHTQAATKPNTRAHAYVVMDAHSGEVLLQNNADKKIYPASTVKLMTALVVLDLAPITKSLKVTQSAKNQVASDVAKLHLKVGTSYTVNEYLHMLLLASDGESAVMLAQGLAGSTSKFVSLMNKKAKKLGLTHTSFDNPIGLDIGSDFHKTYTTANDFAILGRVAMSNGTIRRIVSKGKYKINKSRIKNTNLFYDRFSLSEDSKYKIIGTKTGTTRAAGKVLIATAVDEKGHEVICAFFGNSTSEALYQDIKKLFDFTFSKNHKGKLELSKGFWDTRYTSNEELIRDYANDELIFGTNGKFNPKKELSAKKAARLINEITGLNLKAKELKSMTKEEAVVYADSLL